MFDLLIDKQPKLNFDSCIATACETAEKCGFRLFNIRNDAKDNKENFLDFRTNK